MVRPRSSGRRCFFESLEDRQMLAGDVTAKISGGNLVIKGDSLANGITIAAGSTAGTVVVTGVTAGGSATTVNSGTTAVTLSGFTGGLKIDMKGGDDSVTITDLTVTGDAKLEGGRGDDTFDVSGSTFHGALTTNLGDGDDTLTFDSTTVSGKAKFKGRHGDDDATITDSTFSKLSVSLGKGDDSLTMSGTTASVDTSLNGRRGTNTFSNGTDDSLASLAVKHFNETTTGDDTPPTDSDVSLNAVSAISENGKAALTGSFTDTDLTDAHTVTVSWGDPNNAVNSAFTVPATSSLTAGQTITATSTDATVLTITSISSNQVNFSVQHQYLNDGIAPGNFTNNDTSTISVTVTSGGGFDENGTTTVVVNDVSPAVALNAVTGVTENSSATLTGSYTDIGLLDGQAMVINWGDSNSTANSTFTISPIQNAAGTAILTNGQTVNSSTDSAVLTITSIDATTGKVGFSVQHLYLDDGGNGTASDTISISVSVTDSDAQSGANTTMVTVSDAAPTVVLDPIPSVAVNGTATLTGAYTDVGLLDQHSLLVDFGDGSIPQFLVPPVRNAAGAPTLTVGQTINSTNSTVSAVLTVTSFNLTTGQVGFSVQHQYTAAGSNIPVGVTVLDDDTLSGSGSTSITVGTS
jgi:hypothetical protein